MSNLKSTLIGLLQAFIALVKAEPGQAAELEALKAKVVGLQDQLRESLSLDDDLRAVISEAVEAAAAATSAPAVEAPAVEAPVVEAPVVEAPTVTPTA